MFFLMTGFKRSGDASQHDHCGGTDLTTHPSVCAQTSHSLRSKNVLETRLAERTSFQQTSASRQRSRSRLGSHMYFRQRVIIAPLITSDANNQVYEKSTRRPT